MLSNEVRAHAIMRDGMRKCEVDEEDGICGRVGMDGGHSGVHGAWVGHDRGP